MPYCVGLTGGIGCGKTTVARVFGELGAAVVDTDEISHELTRARGDALPAIRAEFGPECISADGALDRARMRRLVFDDPPARRRLEAILHPLIRARARARVAAAREPYVLVVVPLLFETGAYADLVQRVLVVDCPEQTQISRTVERSKLTRSEVRAIMDAQLPRAERVARADDVISNDSDIEALRRQAAKLHSRYLALARGDASSTSSPRAEPN